MNQDSPLSMTVAQLERETAVLRKWRIGDMKLLAEAYEIHWLMFGPLLIEEVQGQLCHLQPNEAFENVSARPDNTMVQIKQTHSARLLRLFRGGRSAEGINTRLREMRTGPTSSKIDHHLGENVEYASPLKKLVGTEDIAIVQLTLNAGGTSDWHRHPGDELMFILEGKIHVHLQDSGIHTELGAGDFIHFYAEQKHGAINPGKKVAKVLIIRFLQLATLGTRYRFHGEATKHRVKQAFAKRARQEYAKSLMPYDLTESSENDNRKVMDRSGLGQLLQIAAKANGMYPNKLVLRAKDRKWSYNVQRFNHIHDGMSPVTQEELLQLAVLYKLYPITLFDYLYPVHRPAVQVTNPDCDKSGPTNWSVVPKSFVSTDDISYLVPRQRLADSDMSVCFLRMPPSSQTQKNKHPGFELILPVSGAVTIEIESDESDKSESHDLSHNSHCYAHFVSDSFHKIINKSNNEAKLMVIRFYGAPLTAPKIKGGRNR